MPRPASPLDAIAEIARILAYRTDAGALTGEIVERARSVLDVEAGILYRYEPDSGDLVVMAVCGNVGPGVVPGSRVSKDTGAAGRAVQERRPVTTADGDAVLAVPFIVKAAVVGVFVARDRPERAFTADDVRLAEVLADHAAVALEHARLYAEAERRRRDAEELARLARVLAESEHDLAVVGARIVQTLLELVEAETCALRLVRPDGSTELVALSGAARTAFAPGDVQGPGIGVVGLAVRDRRVVTSTDALTDAGVVLSDKLRRRMETSGASAVLAAPLEVRGTVIGVLSLADGRGRQFTEREVALMRAFADQVAGAVERARLWAESEQRREEAEQANRSKDEFLAVLSHELRTPLTAILGWVRILRTRSLPDERRDAALEVIERNTRAQTQLINDLLEVSRIVAGKLHLEAYQVDLVAVVLQGITALTREANTKGVTVDRVLDRAARPVLGDPMRLQQIVTNLLSNALKFTPAGGSIEVRLEPADAMTRLTVADTGSGITAEALPHIFDRFRQGDSTLTRAHGGLGLGLAIVRHLVDLHGGRVSAHSNGPGQGSTFVVELPTVAPVAARHDPGPAATKMARLDGLRILLVEDEPDTRELVRFVLQGQGASVTESASVEEALACFRASTPDVIVSDLGMPGQDGYDLLRAVQATGASAPPVIALTAFAGADSRERALAAGFVVHVPKPVEPEALILAVTTAVAKNMGGLDGPPKPLARSEPSRETRDGPR